VPPFELRSIVAAPSESVFLWSGLKMPKCRRVFRALPATERLGKDEDSRLRLRLRQDYSLSASDLALSTSMVPT